MTMRKNKVPRKVRVPPSHLTAQMRATFDSLAKLLGIGAGVDTVMRNITKRHDKIEAPAKITPREKTAWDYIHLAKAEARRARQNATRSKSYAHCIGGNWGKTLPENFYLSEARVANALHVSKEFMKRHWA